MSSKHKKDRFNTAPARATEAPVLTIAPNGKGRQAERVERRRGKSRGMTMGTKVTLAVVAALVALAGIYFVSNLTGAKGSSASASAYPYQVGSPGAGYAAPPIKLPSTTGGTFNLASQRGKTVLLFFEEGVGCEPCWTQIKDIQAHWSPFRRLGIDEMAVITTNTLPQLRQKVADEHIHVPVLADTTTDVSVAYTANKYGMMGDQMDGHTFIIVGKDGVIKWRADYGGAPKYIMYLPVPALITDMRKGLHGQAA